MSKLKESSIPVIEKSQPPIASQDLKFPAQRNVLTKDKRKVECTFGQPFIRRGAMDEPMVQLKPSGTKHLSRSNTNRNDELVKHMSNLPGYLQKAERVDNSQRNALNFGVMNWESLERWKQGEKSFHSKGNTTTSSSTIRSLSMPKGPATVPSTSSTRSLAPERNIPASNRCRLNTSYDQRSLENLVQLRQLETLQRISSKDGRSYTETINIDKGKTKEACKTAEPDDTISSSQENGKTADPEDVISSSEENGKTAEPEDIISSSQENGKTADGEINHYFRKSFSSSSKLSESSRTSFDSTLTESHLRKFEDFSSPEFRSSLDFHSDIPHSCPLPIPDNKSDNELRPDKYLTCQYPNEQPASKGRFSFGISKMTRSLSSKEGSFSNRAKSSPLRRLLDPLLKPKETKAAEIPKPVSQNFDYVNPGERVQALLQVTVKNKLPLFKLVVENSKEILAAALKNNTTSLTYAFYSVSDIKKKSAGWLSTGSKDNKKSGFGFNIIGEMKVSRQKMNSQDVVNEFVLCGGNLGSVDRELAAIVVKNSVDENQETCKRAMVILPHGVHGSPQNGKSSSLMSRWRGKCDCEGWDLGCKLKIFTNGNQSNKNPKPLSSRCGVHLFVQGNENKPVFSFAPLKDELYSLEYNASMSMLQAFSICIAFMNSLKSHDVDLIPGKFFLTPPPSPVGRV